MLVLVNSSWILYFARLERFVIWPGGYVEYMWKNYPNRPICLNSVLFLLTFISSHDRHVQLILGHLDSF